MLVSPVARVASGWQRARKCNLQAAALCAARRAALSARNAETALFARTVRPRTAPHNHLQQIN